MSRVRVDSGAVTHLPVCEICGWRGHVTAAKLRALVQAVRHERIAHPERRNAEDSLCFYQRREKLRTPAPR